MKERPILFSAPMVRALLAGTKTVTRRLVKPQPEYDGDPRWPGWKWPCAAAGTMLEIREMSAASPYGGRGDRLWVKETHALRADVDWRERPAKAAQYALYRASYEGELNQGLEWHRYDRWRPSIHLPRPLARILLEVVNVRVERLHDITEADARAEGIEAVDGEIPDEVHCARAKRIGEMMESGRVVFSLLWDRLNGARAPWESNPWVWRVEFKRIDLDPKTTPGEAASRVVVPSSR